MRGRRGARARKRTHRRSIGGRGAPEGRPGRPAMPSARSTPDQARERYRGRAHGGVRDGPTDGVDSRFRGSGEGCFTQRTWSRTSSSMTRHPMTSSRGLTRSSANDMFAAPSRLGVASGTRPRRVPRRRAAMAASDPAPFAVSDDDSASARVTFFTHSLCPYAHRTALALAEKGVPHKRIHVDLSNKPRWYIDVNPRGVPALETADGAVLTESLDLVEFVDEAFEDRTSRLRGGGGRVASRARSTADSSPWVFSSSAEVGVSRAARPIPRGVRGSRESAKRSATSSTPTAALSSSAGRFPSRTSPCIPSPSDSRRPRAGFKRTELRDLGGDRFGRWLDAMRKSTIRRKPSSGRRRASRLLATNDAFGLFRLRDRGRVSSVRGRRRAVRRSVAVSSTRVSRTASAISKGSFRFLPKVFPRVVAFASRPLASRVSPRLVQRPTVPSHAALGAGLRMTSATSNPLALHASYVAFACPSPSGHSATAAPPIP